MKKRASHFTILLIFIGLVAALSMACQSRDTPYEDSLKWKQSIFQSLQDNLSGPTESRIQKIPAGLLKTVQDYDRSIGILNSDHYTAHEVSADERALIKSYIGLLPPAHQRFFSAKLLAVYFIDEFSGAGMTEWVIDAKGRIHYYLILNSALLNKDIDEWLSYKDDSQFDKATASPSIRVRTQTQYKALMYGLLHEGAHIVDYELGITPYMDPQHRRYIGRTQIKSEFTEGVWLDGTKPVAQYDLKHRKEINTYGIFPKRGLITRTELEVMLSQLAKSPFVSFYSATSWNEDLADYMTYSHIEKHLGGSVTVELINAGKIMKLYSPIKTSVSKQREESVREFYD